MSTASLVVCGPAAYEGEVEFDDEQLQLDFATLLQSSRCLDVCLSLTDKGKVELAASIRGCLRKD